MEGEPPAVIVLAGPNGAGKSTAARSLLQGHMGLTQFVNADDIARGLSGFDPGLAAVRAGRIMLTRMRELSAEGVSFAFETTLASRSYAPWLKTLREQGYRTGLFFLWLPTPEVAIARVRQRVPFRSRSSGVGSSAACGTSLPSTHLSSPSGLCTTTAGPRTI